VQSLIQWLESLAGQVSVTWFTLIGAFIEELIAPIPSPLVMTLAGSISASQQRTLLFLLLLAVIGSVGKTLGSLIIYLVADKAEDFFIDRFGRFLGVSHGDTEGLGKMFSQGRRDDLTIFLLRAIPIMPTAPVSVIAGLIKLDLRTYIVSSFLGTIIRNLIYLYLGYTSLGAIESVTTGFDSLEKFGYLALAIGMAVAVIWMYQKRRQGKGLSMVDSLLSGRQKKTK
jgi:membrane protein DedA with SNARE-associated domain